MLKQYIAFKKKVFKQLGIRLTAENIAHMGELSSEYAIDAYCRQLIVG